MKNQKKIISIVLCVMLGITGCSNGVSQKEYDQVVEERDKYKELYEAVTQSNVSDQEDTVVTTQNEDIDYVSQLDITEYSYVNSIKNTIYCMVIKNNSDKTLKFSVNITANDQEGNLVGAQTMEEYAVESGYEVLMTTSFDGDKAEEFVYNLDAEVDEYYSPVLSDLDVKITKADKKVIVTCKNTGNESAKFVKASALFFNKEGELVYSNETYCVANNSSLEAGKTISKEIDAFREFHDVKIYMTGRR